MGGDERSTRRKSRGRDNQVMGTSRTPLPTDEYQKLGVNSGKCGVIVQNGNRGDHFFEEFQPATPGLSSRQLDAHVDFRNRDSGDCDVVLICNDVIKIELRPFGID